MYKIINMKILRSYTLDMVSVERLQKMKEETGINASRIVEMAVKRFYDSKEYEQVAHLTER